jgi:micrococcal nuclease
VRLAAALLALGCGPAPLPAPADDASPACGGLLDPARPCRGDARATVERALDGDTLDVLVEGSGPARVRLIGIDAPERDEGECGETATRHLAALAPAGTALRLSFDAECQDAYARDLAYAWNGDRMINAAMLADGFAQACPFAPNTTRADAFACLAEHAASSGAGTWAQGCHRDACFE